MTFITSIVLAVIAAGGSRSHRRRCSPTSVGLDPIDMAQTRSRRARARVSAFLIAIGLVLMLALRDRTRLCFTLLALFVAVDLGSRVRTIAPRIDASVYAPPRLAQALSTEPQPVRIFNDADSQLLVRPAPMAENDQAWQARNALLPEAQALWGIESALELDLASTDLAPSVDYASLFFQAPPRPTRRRTTPP